MTSHKWHSTNFPGVRFRKHPTRKHGVNFDQYFAIRYQIDGKRKEESLGWASEGWTAKKAYQTLNELREAATTGKGATRLKERRREKALAQEESPTLKDAAESFIEYCKRSKREKTIRGYMDGLAKAQEYTPARGTGKLGTWKLKEIQRRHIASLIDNIAAESASVAIQVRSSLSALYGWAVQSPQEYVQSNIVRDTPRPPKPKPRDRYLTGKEAGILWTALQTADGDPAMIRCLQFAMLVGCRISEASGMMSNEIDGDWWTIPAERFKGKRPHRVYLTETAKKLIAGPGPLVFPSKRTGRPFETSSFSSWLTKNKHFGLEKFSCHDFRRTIGSGLAELRFSQDTIAATIGHKLQGVTAEHYIRHKYDDEKKAALIRWEQHILKCASPDKHQAEVIPLHASNH